MPRRSKRLRTGAAGEEDLMAQAASHDEVLSGSPNDGPCPAFLKFLECHVVVDQLMQFLKIEEMKVLSLVSKELLAAVRRSIEFSKRSRFNINREPDASAVDLHNRFPFKWKQMWFDVSLPMRVVNQFADKLKFVESLILYYKYIDPEDRPYESEKLSLSSIVECCSRTQEILSISTNLRELQLDVFLMKYPLSEMFSSREKQQSMWNLESLIVNGSCPSSLNSLEWTQFQLNMLQLSRYPFSKLRHFSVKDASDEACDFVPDIIMQFKETLEILELNQRIWWSEEMKGLRCPKLKKLFAGIYEDELKDVAEFVEKQPLLEELLLEIFSEYSTEDLKCFQGRLQNLRKFQYCLESYYKPGVEVIAVDWTFLETMTKLEEFTVWSPYGGRGPEMIDRVPASVKKLNLKCGWKEQDFWPRNAISLDIGNHLTRLNNLTHLSLDQCSDALRDVGLQTIIKSLPNLMDLRLKYCMNLTNFGISGVRRDTRGRRCRPGVPLSDLKGLLELEISHCNLLTEPCILRVVRFECLRKFIFETSKENKGQKKNAFEFRIKKQNPRLTYLERNSQRWLKNGLVWTHYEEEDYDYEEEEEEDR